MKSATANAPVTWGQMYLMCVELGMYRMANYCLDHIMTGDAA